MAFETTYNCDVCGIVGGAESTLLESRKSAVREGWWIIRVDGRVRLVCVECNQKYRGTNEARKELRRQTSSTSEA